MTDAGTLTKWIEAYRKAWESNQPEDIAALFTADGRYFTAPYEAPWEGRKAIVEGWISAADQPGTTTFVWEPVVITDDVQVIRATTTYPSKVYRNLWVLKLDAEGLCREYTEYWMQQP
jgi:uncharacterized protein (TIGR02246 family)